MRLSPSKEYIAACAAIGETPVADITQSWWHRSSMSEVGRLDAAEFARHCASVTELVRTPKNVQVLKNSDGSLDIWSPSGARCEYNTVPVQAAVDAAVARLFQADGADLVPPSEWHLTKSER